MKIVPIWVNRVDSVVVFSNGLTLFFARGRFRVVADKFSMNNSLDSFEAAAKIARVELGLV